MQTVETVPYHSLLGVFRDAPVPQVPADLIHLNGRALKVRHGISNPMPPPFFVPPELVIENSVPLTQPFWLVSAPAAVGKSTLAMALSHEISATGRQVLYFPLRGTTNVGRDWFGGLLAAVFDRASQEQLQTALRNTQLVVLLDGYDELSMTDAQIESHRLLAQELADYVGSADGGRVAPSLVLLFRSAIKSMGIFDALLDHAAELRLEYFREKKQVAFLSEYLKQRGVPVGAEDLLTDLRSALVGAWTSERDADPIVTSFLGHAPVLKAIGDLILESRDQTESANPAQLVQQLRTNIQTPDWGGVLLLRIVDELLKRESGKFPLNAFRQRNLFDVTSADAYPPAFQELLLKTLVHVALAKSRDWESPLGNAINEQWQALHRATAGIQQLDDDDRRQLEVEFVEEVKQKLQHHPFLELATTGVEFANPLYFEKYLADLLFEKQIEPANAFSRYGQPSHYLAEFLLHRFSERDIGKRPDLLFYIVRSLLMAGGESLGVELMFSDGGWECVVSEFDGGSDLARFRYGGDILDLEVPSGELLEGVDIDGRGKGVVILTATGTDPSNKRLALSQVSVSAKEVLVEASHLACESVTFEADSVLFSDYLATIEGLATLQVRGDLHISDYLRHRYGDRVARLDDTGAGEEAFRKTLNGMLTWFRKRGKSTFGVYLKRWHTAVLKKDGDTLAVSIAEFLKQLGVLSEDRGERMVFLNEDRLAAFGVHYRKHNEVSFEGAGFQRLLEEWKRYEQAL